MAGSPCIRVTSCLLCVLALFVLSACETSVVIENGAPEDCEPVSSPHHDPLEQRGAIQHVHDPDLIRHGGYYYLFSTGHGIPIRRSSDLIEWEQVAEVFEESVPGWAYEVQTEVEFPWAPDIAYFNDTYHLYYSISSFGQNRSAIGLTTNEKLDDTGTWEDHGPVLQSYPETSDFNAIDPNVIIDQEGTPWLTWGSFWGGVRMQRIDPETGHLADGAVMHALAARPEEHAIEAPYIIHHDGYYYLFVSFDSCCQGVESTYRVMVGRSEELTGPYIDRSGQSMMQGGGTLVLKGYGRIRGPGHNAVFEEDGKHFLLHHFYDAHNQGLPTLQIRSLLWDEDGWPLAGEPFDGTFPHEPDAEVLDVVGSWGHSVDFDTPFQIELYKDGRAEHCKGAGTWSLEGSTLTLDWSTDSGSGGGIERLIVSEEGSWYTGRDEDGRVIRGTRASNE